jgi:hypothetical protein
MITAVEVHQQTPVPERQVSRHVSLSVLERFGKEIRAAEAKFLPEGAAAGDANNRRRFLRIQRQTPKNGSGMGLSGIGGREARER